MSSHEAVHINLAGIAIGNGLTDPLVQYDYYADMACNNSYAPILTEAVCDEMRGKQGTCDRLIKACYSSGSRFACVPAVCFRHVNTSSPFIATTL
jgi:cathepsin A (carboxypeptidase C)